MSKDSLFFRNLLEHITLLSRMMVAEMAPATKRCTEIGINAAGELLHRNVFGGTRHNIQKPTCRDNLRMVP